MATSRLRRHLYRHPRLTGALLTVLLFLSQAGTALAGGCGAFHGP